MVNGRAGIGSHKHGTSGHAGPSPKAKLNRMLAANKEQKRKPKPLAHTDVKEAFKSTDR